MFSFSKQRTVDHRRSVSSIASFTRPTPKAEALSKDFFSSLIQNESDFRSNSYTVETLDMLVQLYARAVEYYDSIQDEISSYFTYKIQDILATKRSLKMLIDRKEQEKKSSIIQSPEKVLESQSKRLQLKEVDMNEINVQASIEEVLAEESSDDEGEKSRREWKKKKEEKKQTKSLASLKSQKQRFAQFYHQVETQKNIYKQDMHVLFASYMDSSKENDQTVKKSIQVQRQRLKQKIQQKKNNSLLALNNTFNSVTSSNISEQIFKRGDSNEDSILRDLESSEAFGEVSTPLIKRRLKSQSLFSKKKESSNMKVNVDPVEEVQEKGSGCLTPIEKLSTENSLTMEFNAINNETEAMCTEIKAVA